MKRAHKFISIARGIISWCVVAVWAFASARAQTALPDDIAIAAPSSTVAQEVAAFSGAWLGAWGGELPTGLVVEQISPDGTAHGIYSWVDLQIHRFQAGW